jgi:hypothetical protein
VKLTWNVNNTPSIAFLIPFASRRVKSKWKIACAHLRQTLNSIQNSTSGNYCVVVAGHEAPDFDVRFDSRFYFLSLNHALPTHDHWAAAQVLDKLTKIAAAWNYAKPTWNPKYVMKLDADDLISSRLVEWLDNANGEAGYLIKCGWVWRSGSRYLIQRTEYFDRTCGSCLIVRSDVAEKRGPFLTEMDGVRLDEADLRFAGSDQYSLVPGSQVTTLLLNDSCIRYAAQFDYLGHSLSNVPFGAVVYRIGNPDSVEGRRRPSRRQTRTLRMLVGKIRRTRFITKSLRREFMLG